jgi:hypothetical protein
MFGWIIKPPFGGSPFCWSFKIFILPDAQSRQNCGQSRPSGKDLPDLRACLCLAQKVGTLLGIGPLLFRALPEGTGSVMIISFKINYK